MPASPPAVTPRHAPAPPSPPDGDGAHGSGTAQARDVVAPAVRVASEWTWRLLVIALGIYGLVKLVEPFAEILIPLLVALLLAALLHPVVGALARVGVPRGAASLLCLLLTIVVVVALFVLVGQQAVTGFPELRDQSVAGLNDLQNRLAQSRLHLSSTALSDYAQQIENAASKNQGALLSGALGVASTATKVVEGLFIVLFSTFFFLSSGSRIWAWVLRILPAGSRGPLDEAGRSGWVTLSHYIRATLIVAVVDGLGVGVGAAVLGVPLAIPLGVVVFIGAFIPVVGALVSGIIAVLVALVAQGPVVALTMLGVVLLVNQVEAHGLQPFLLGRAVEVHPLAVILCITGGATVAGIPGALFAVPIAAVTNTMVTSLAGSNAPGPADVIDEDDAPLAPVRPGPTDVQDGATTAGSAT